MCVVETMSLVGYKIVYIVNFVPNPDWHLDSKWRSRNRDGGRVFKKLFDVKIKEGSDDGRNHFRCRNLGESEDGAGLRFSAERRIFLRWLHL